jgi:hypothetical protein
MGFILNYDDAIHLDAEELAEGSIREVMNGCDAKAQRVGLAQLTAAERVVVLVSRANFEIRTI